MKNRKRINGKSVLALISVIITSCTSITPTSQMNNSETKNTVGAYTSLSPAQIAEFDREYSFGIKVISDAYVTRALSRLAAETGITNPEKVSKIKTSLEYFLYRKGAATKAALCSAGNPTALHGSLMGVSGISSISDAEFIVARDTPCSIPDSSGSSSGGSSGSSTEFRVNDIIAEKQTDSDIAMLYSGGTLGNPAPFVVVWQEKDGDSDIYGQMFNEDGTKTGNTHFMVNTNTNGVQTEPSVARSLNGNYVVVWTHEEGGDTDIHAQIFGSSGSKIGNEFQVNTSSGGSFNPSVAIDSQGNFAVAWEGSGSISAGSIADSHGIWVRKFNSTGVSLPVGNGATAEAYPANFDYTDNIQKNPEIAMSNVGDFVVVWEGEGSAGSSGEPGIWGRRFETSGTIASDVFHVSTLDSYPNNPSVGIDHNSNFVVTWETDASIVNVTDAHAILAGIVPSNSHAMASQFIVNTYTDGIQSNPAVSMNYYGEFVITWDGEGSGDSHGVWAKSYSSAGVSTGSSDIHVNTNTAADKGFPSVAISNDSPPTFVITWQSFQDGGTGTLGDWGIYAQRFDSNASPY